MTSLRLAAAIVAAFLTATLAPPAGRAAVVVTQPVFTLGGASAPAGSPETFVITRISGGQGVYVLFQTSDGTAHAGTDYTATRKLIYLKGGTKSAAVSVPTFVNGGSAIPLTFKATIANTAIPVSAIGTIVEPTLTCPDGTVIAAGGTCPPPPPATQTCPDGSVILATDVCPAPAALNSWVAAPLQDGSFAQVKANDSLWDMTGPGLGRPLVPGEIVAVYFNGWGNEADATTSFAIYALSDGSSGRAKAADLAGVAPVGSPPGLPANWWVPGMVTANKTCTDARTAFAGEPGVTQGGVYRAAMLAGSHMKLASGVTGYAGTMWQVFASGNLNSPASAAFTVVTGDCLTGQ